MTIAEIILAFIGLLNAGAFMYWMHVDSKLTARGLAMDARLDATIASTNARLDATWAELIALRKDVK